MHIDTLTFNLVAINNIVTVFLKEKRQATFDSTLVEIKIIVKLVFLYRCYLSFIYYLPLLLCYFCFKRLTLRLLNILLAKTLYLKHPNKSS